MTDIAGSIIVSIAAIILAWTVVSVTVVISWLIIDRLDGGARL